MPSSYPDTTYAGDPRAPWNEPDGRACCECAHWHSIDDDRGICDEMFGRVVFAGKPDTGMLCDAAAMCVTFDDDACARWEEE